MISEISDMSNGTMSRPDSCEGVTDSVPPRLNHTKAMPGCSQERAISMQQTYPGKHSELSNKTTTSSQDIF